LAYSTCFLFLYLMAENSSRA